MPTKDTAKSQRTFKRARQALGLDLEGMARLLRLAGSKVVRRYENGTRAPGGPVMLCADLLPPLVVLLREWEGWLDIEVLEESRLSEMAADAVIDLRKLLRAGGLLESKTQ